MKLAILKDIINYDGSQISQLWAYNMGIKGDSVVCFHGPMYITPNNMKDLEDEINRKIIKGDDLVHIIVEKFDSPGNIKLAYYMQRLLIVSIKDVLEKYEIKAERDGDDIFIDKKKLTVSIASAGVSSEKIHCGINITNNGTPDDIETSSLLDIGIDDWVTFAKEVSCKFIKEIDDIENDITKTRTLS